MMDLSRLLIEDIGLSNRSLNGLKRNDIHTVQDMILLSEETLMNMRGLGQKSVNEILLLIEHYKNCNDGSNSITAQSEEEMILDWLKETDASIECLTDLSAKSYNLLMFSDLVKMHQVVFLKYEELMDIPSMNEGCASEILECCKEYLEKIKDEIVVQNVTAQPEITIHDLFRNEDYHEAVLEYVRENNLSIENSMLPNRAKNQLKNNGYTLLSEIILMRDQEFSNLPAMGQNSVNAIRAWINTYQEEHGARLMAYCLGDKSALLSDENISKMILKLYREVAFRGYSLDEMFDSLQLEGKVEIDRMKKIIGRLIFNKELEYADYRCYRVYDHFETWINKCDRLSDRNRDILLKRLSGMTLEDVGRVYDLSRERIRQIVNSEYAKVKQFYYQRTTNEWFDEDYYQYFYSTYMFDTDEISEWLSVSGKVWNYLDIAGIKQGSSSLDTALEDYKGLDLGLRLKVKNYLNRKKIYIDGRWIEKRKSKLEDYVISKFCTEECTFDEFVEKYNHFLKSEGIQDESLYITEETKPTRRNRIPELRTVLWKMNEKMRYYDIDSRDYTELFLELDLDSYEDTGLSTLKFFRDYPKLMKQYDIRDQYELHNLFRKVIKEGSFHDFHCGRMPEIQFGTFDRDGEFINLLKEHAPISVLDFCQVIYDVYGFDPATVQGGYLGCLNEYNHRSFYRINQKTVPVEHQMLLMSQLTKDFYYIDEINNIYYRLFPNAETDVINPYSIKKLGFNVRSRYAYRNYSSLEELIRVELTKDDIVDQSKFRAKYNGIMTYYEVLLELKTNKVLIEFEPDRLVNVRRLNQNGVTEQMLHDFCDQVYDFVEDGSYFSVHSIRKDGFESELFQLGFSNWFYGSLLLNDARFSYSTMFGNTILYKGVKDITIKSFEMTLIQKHQSIDLFDLMNEMNEEFGCHVQDRSDLVYKVQDTEIYYDRILDRLYANEELYYQEIESKGEAW